MAALEVLAYIDYSLAIKAGVHYTLCGGTICKLGTKVPAPTPPHPPLPFSRLHTSRPCTAACREATQKLVCAPAAQGRATP